MTKDPDNPWRENVRAQTAQGKRFERVRLVDDPLSDGQWFLWPAGSATSHRARAGRRRLQLTCPPGPTGWNAPT
ncbi:DUF6879 family protein [Streptomyces sp. NPDC002785]|uniref:DUF6879 family protein n=1 Tax=Streptomyces sp. NPDC002785 TaxID=3154543 RepID=UPI00332EA4D4